MNKNKYMLEAIKEAKIALIDDEVPIGCVIVKNGKIIARAHNMKIKNADACSHAEILAIRSACNSINDWRLEDCDLYVTLEPCPMCAGAIIQSRIANLYYGAKDLKGGCIESCIKLLDVKGFNHYPKYSGGIREQECSELLTNFFLSKRKQRAK